MKPIQARHWCVVSANVQVVYCVLPSLFLTHIFSSHHIAEHNKIGHKKHARPVHNPISIERFHSSKPYQRKHRNSVPFIKTGNFVFAAGHIGFAD